MSTYIHFTEEQKQRAAAVDLEEFLRFRGEKLIPSGREKRLAKDHSVTAVSYTHLGNERYLLEVHAPAYKEKLFGSAGGR